ncbi:hypothetical protein O181_066247 [Austropuccinia psidii MF-1]|uniref:RNase H type-1 domain-containing protein n=1 Tax=Austropuccinia psidii MF-1 TaxID=1389203 RepID=A0A9Q3EYT3_9BASI|nr:hypothetical protein [Austropuccinia psidii MF-1]
MGTEKDGEECSILETLDSLKPKEIVLFPDGSEITNKGKGETAVIEKEKIIIRKQIPKTDKVSNFENELVGIILAIESARKEIDIKIIKGNKMNSIYVFRNNQGKLSKLAYPFKPSREQYLYLKIFHSFKSLQKIFPIKLWWCSGHIGITGNELADTEAKNFALDSTKTIFNLKNSLIKLSQEKKEKNNNQLTQEEAQCTKIIKSKPALLIKALNRLEKAQSSILHQSQSEHVGLNKHLKLINLRGDPLCKTCDKPESVNHLMTHLW